MGRSLVSIVITSYNYERFLAQAIESALHQDYSPLEVLVVDDGSKDGSLALARSFPVRVVAREHAGLAATMRAAVEAARGEFIVLLSADDVLHPRFVSATMAALDGRTKAFAYSGAYLFGPHVGVPRRALRWRARPFSPHGLVQGPYITCAGPFPKKVFQDVGGYDHELPVLEDWDFWLRVVQAGYEGVPVDEPLYYYRQHSRSTRNKSDRRRRETLRRAIVAKYSSDRPQRLRYRLRLVPLAAMLGLSFVSRKATARLASWWLPRNPFPGPSLEPVPPSQAEPTFPWLTDHCHRTG